ncbi:MAG: cation diffusion facilitator family transporter [Fimbriimonas sp.]|nr:cation diffusion facilitator family transporter [Fimbriimonas sp.]
MAETNLANRTADRMKRRASMLSLVTNVSLTFIKVLAAVITGSVSLMSESIHSGGDVIASLVAFYSVRAAAVPPDEEHPYGHGKIESLTSFGESILLLMMVGFIFKEAIDRLAHASPIRSLGLGLWIMCLSAAASLSVGAVIRHVALRTGSPALKANGRHVMIDFWTSTGVVTALLVTQFTGWQTADAWFAMALGLWIAGSSIAMARESVEQLIDRRVSDDDIERIRDVLGGISGMISFHRLRTRHSGNVHYIEVHIVVPNDWTVVQGHEMADRVEGALEAALAPAQAVVHIDPYDAEKAHPSRRQDDGILGP